MAYARATNEFFSQENEWSGILNQLREIILDTGLEETLKWGAPVYTWKKKNIVGLGAFKSYAGIWFFQGVFLSDPANKLMNAQEGKTKGLRQWRFGADEVLDAALIKSYVLEAIQNQKAGKEIKPERKALVIPPELSAVLKNDPSMHKAFQSLKPGQQKE